MKFATPDTSLSLSVSLDTRRLCERGSNDVGSSELSLEGYKGGVPGSFPGGIPTFPSADLVVLVLWGVEPEMRVKITTDASPPGKSTVKYVQEF